MFGLSLDHILLIVLIVIVLGPDLLLLWLGYRWLHYKRGFVIALVVLALFGLMFGNPCLSFNPLFWFLALVVGGIYSKWKGREQVMHPI